MDKRLIRAAKDNDMDQVVELLDQGLDPNLQDRDGWTALIYTSTGGNLEMLQALLDHGADPNLQTRNGWTGLMHAADYSNFDVMEKLLEHGADPNLQNNNGWTALMYTIYSMRPENAKILLEAGANPILEDQNMRSAIEMAKERDLTDLVDLLKQFIIDPVIVDPKTGLSNLLILAANGPLAGLKTVIDTKNLDLNQQDQDGNTALIYAVVNQKPDHVALLLDRGVDPNLANNGGGTPLAYAFGQPEIEQMLIDAGAHN